VISSLLLFSVKQQHGGCMKQFNNFDSTRIWSPDHVLHEIRDVLFCGCFVFKINRLRTISACSISYAAYCMFSIVCNMETTSNPSIWNYTVLSTVSSRWTNESVETKQWVWNTSLCILMIIIIMITVEVRKLLLGWSKQGGWDGRGMWRAWGRWGVHTTFWLGGLKGGDH
jgi:hypothetical protein